MAFRPTSAREWAFPTPRNSARSGANRLPRPAIQGNQRMSSSKFDIIVYGATGCTGQLVAEYLAAHYKGDANLKWAMAGRSKDKLASVRDAIGASADTPLIVADASDPASLKAMVAQAQSVISTVGPYQLYGSDLVAACVAAGGDFFLLPPEPGWARPSPAGPPTTAAPSPAPPRC